MVWMVAILREGCSVSALRALREIRDRGFRTREQVRSVLGTECLAMVPSLTPEGEPAAAAATRADVAMFGSGAESREYRLGPKIMRTIVDQPSSLYAEAIRSIRLTVD